MPRVAAFRTFVLYHIVHHRGQLSVYLRLNDVPVPAIYGPTGRRRIAYRSGLRRSSPRPSLRNGHAMTLYSWGNPRYFPRLPAPTRRYFDVDRDARVVADCHWQPRAVGARRRSSRCTA